MAGEEGRGALVAVLRELVARRCQMGCQLGALFQLGPTAGGYECSCGVRLLLCQCVLPGGRHLPRHCQPTQL